MNIAQNIERAARHFPHKVAIQFEGRHYSYEHLHQLVNQLANSLKGGLEVEPSDRIAIFLPNIPEFIIAYLAIQKIGGIAVSVNVMLKEEEVRYVLNDSEAKIVFTTGELRENVKKENLQHLKHVIIAEGEAQNDIDFHQFLNAGNSKAKARFMDRDDPAALVYTSGTTGFPKGATLSHGNVVSNAYSKLHYCLMSPQDRMLLFLPLFHCFGQNAILNSGILAGSTIILQRRFMIENVLDTIAQDVVTMFFGVPSIYIRLLNAGIENYDFSSIRYYFAAAATLPTEIARRWFDLQQKFIYVGYGLTETSPFSSYNHDLRYRYGSIGTPIENVEMKIVDVETKEDVTTGELGEIAIRGPNVMLGYWRNQEATDEVIRNGWFHSGDIGMMDDEGYFYIVDRLKDMINMSGFKIYPAEVENVLYTHEAVSEVAVYGINNPISGEAVKARVILKPSYTHINAKELQYYCRQKMAIYKVPQQIEFVSSFPKNATGKILKRVIYEEEKQRGLR